MKSNRYLLLRYILIVLMMLAPVRGVVAMQQTGCDDSVSITVKHSAMSEMVVVSSSDVKGIDAVESESMQNHCCSEENDCASSCDVNMAGLLQIKLPFYKSNQTNDVLFVELLSNPISRDNPPPFRPPLAFHN